MKKIKHDRTPKEIVDNIMHMLIYMQDVERFMSEEARQLIDDVMADIYRKENNANNEFHDEKDLDDYSSPSLSPYELFEYVENKAQFAEDFRRAVDKVIQFTSRQSRDLAKEVIMYRAEQT